MTNFGNKLEQYVNGNLPACHHPIKAVDDNNFCHKCGKQLEISKNSGVNYVEHLLTRIATLEAENARLTKVETALQNEMLQHQNIMARQVAQIESMQEDAVQNTYAFGLMLKANKEQAAYIEWANAKIKELEEK